MRYLGDGVYAEVRNGMVRLSTNELPTGILQKPDPDHPLADHISVVFLEPDVLECFFDFLKYEKIIPKGTEIGIMRSALESR